MRPSGRANDALRSVSLIRGFSSNARGSVLVEFGNTKVLCTASCIEQIPRWLRGKGKGWVTAEYGMLPGSTNVRCDREAVRGKQNGRTLEIQRLIGRSLRASVDLELLGERQITVDCDVIQADGGTRSASITGGMVALIDALQSLYHDGLIKNNPFKRFVAAVSVGIYKGQPILDLDYLEDSNADADVNIVMAEKGHLVEVQGTAEESYFSREDLNSMLDLGETGTKQLIELQRQVLVGSQISESSNSIS